MFCLAVVQILEVTKVKEANRDGLVTVDLAKRRAIYKARKTFRTTKIDMVKFEFSVNEQVCNCDPGYDGPHVLLDHDRG